MKLLLLILLPCFAFAQKQKVVIADTFPIHKDFRQQVMDGMNKQHKKYRKNDLYNFNVNKTAIQDAPDSIAFNVKIITKYNGQILWEGKGLFVRSGSNLVAQVSDLVMIKRTSLIGPSGYMNVKADEMESSKQNLIYIDQIKEAAADFLKMFK